MPKQAAHAKRKQRGAWYTPPELVDVVVDGLLDGFGADRTGMVTVLDPACGDGRFLTGMVTVLDPACGDGRFLTAIGDRLEAAGHRVSLTGCDIATDALDSIRDRRIGRIHANALDYDWGEGRFDLVIGNPPYLSQMAASTTRGGSSRHGGGPYADSAAEFLALATRLANEQDGRVGLVLPQSILGARDSDSIRRHVGELADLRWSWWERRQQHFDANVNVCAIGLQRPATGATTPASWTRVVTDRLGVPELEFGSLSTCGRVGDRAELNANFRDEYYALVPAVSDGADGPPLVTSGLVDPGVCHWGSRTVRFAKRDHQHPRVDLDLLTGRFPAWAARKLVPKVLIANQTRIVEAVADPEGRWLPGVPVNTATPNGDTDVWQIAAVLTAPVASIAAWHHGAGTGLSTTSVRVGPRSLGDTPWPAGPLDEAVAALREGAIEACARSVTGAYGITSDRAAPLIDWWVARLPDCGRGI